MNSNLFSGYLNGSPTRKKVFVSHYHTHQQETDQFLRNFGDVFIPRTVGALGNESYISSTKTTMPAATATQIQKTNFAFGLKTPTRLEEAAPSGSRTLTIRCLDMIAIVWHVDTNTN